MAKSTPRGVRNRNPGNIDYNPANDWVGQLPHDPAIEPRFCRFDTPVNGIRAMSVLLQTYQRKHGLYPVRDIVGRWAPGNENDTEAYIRTVCRMLGVDDDETIDVKDYHTARALIVAKIKVECAGYTYPDDVVDEGLRRAGVVRAGSVEITRKPPVKSAATAAASTLAAPGIGLATVASSPELRTAIEATGVSWLIVAVGVIGAGATAYILWHSLRGKRAQ